MEISIHTGVSGVTNECGYIICRHQLTILTNEMLDAGTLWLKTEPSLRFLDAISTKFNGVFLDQACHRLMLHPDDKMVGLVQLEVSKLEIQRWHVLGGTYATDHQLVEKSHGKTSVFQCLEINGTGVSFRWDDMRIGRWPNHHGGEVDGFQFVKRWMASDKIHAIQDKEHLVPVFLSHACTSVDDQQVLLCYVSDLTQLLISVLDFLCNPTSGVSGDDRAQGIY